MISAKIPDKYFEAAGLFFGLLISITIAAQIYSEIRADRPSTLSLSYTMGFLSVFVFWTLYGIRFKRMAVWLSNGIAACMQVILILTVMFK